MAVNSQWSSKNLATFMSWVDHQLFLKIADTKIYLDASSEQVHELCSGGGDKIVLPHQLVLTWAGRPCTYISIDEVTLGGKKAYMANCVQIVAPLWWKHCIFSITDYLRWDAQPANGNYPNQPMATPVSYLIELSYLIKLIKLAPQVVFHQAYQPFECYITNK